jgi:hypothetical protein
MTNNMPKVNKDAAKNKLADNAEGLAILDILIKKDGTLRASKPKVTDDPITGKAAYVWRMACFMVSPKRQHQCMPCTADFDLPAINEETGKWGCAAAREMAKTLKPVEDAIVDSVDKSDWHGVIRWGQVFGAIS